MVLTTPIFNQSTINVWNNWMLYDCWQVLLRCSKTTPLDIYGALVHSMIESGMEAIFDWSKSSVDKLNKIRDKARLCTGALRSTPTICLLQASGVISLHLKHKLLCLKCKAHSLTFYIHPTLSLFADSWHEFYPDTPSFQKFQHGYQKHCLPR